MIETRLVVSVKSARVFRSQQGCPALSTKAPELTAVVEDHLGACRGRVRDAEISKGSRLTPGTCATIDSRS